MDEIEATVVEGSRPCRVHRRVAGVRGDDGYFTPGATTIAVVDLYVQPGQIQLVRQLFGDSTEGDTVIWASLSRLAAAYEEGDVDEVPLGWTSLLIAPPENTEGAPGDRVEWHGRIYEITREQIWDDAGLIPDAKIRVYAAAERGPA